MPTSYSLSPYAGSWTTAEAGHLLRRATFGPTNQQVLDAVSNGMNSTVATLMNIPAIGEPLAYDIDEGIVAEGESWIGAVYPADLIEQGTTAQARYRSLHAWLMERINNEQDAISIAEKMCLFWQNHFGVIASADYRASYSFLMLLRSHALGDFKQLVKDATIDANMLEFLNGNQNSVNSPNENYARELLELFTIGKGPQLGIGDYTNYTEHDITEGAKILTGFHNTGYRSSTVTNMTSVFTASRHDDTIKTLSSKFGDATINPNGAGEYADFIEVIFQQDEVANYICRKFYRYFVSSEITSDVEDNIISGLATTLIANNYNVQPVIEQLLPSEHFYDIEVRGCLIKSPLEMIFSLWNGTESKPDYDVATRYPMHLMNFWITGDVGQSYTSPPSVAGWPAYYQAPTFSQLWLNASHISQRFSTIDWYALYSGIESNGERWSIDALKFLNNLPNPNIAVDVIDAMITVFFPRDTSDSQRLALKSILTNGLPDFEWTIQYDEYIANPSDTGREGAISSQMKKTLAALFKLPEFQTM